MVRLGDLFIHIRNGANIKQGLDDSGYPITRIETISNRIVDRNKVGYAGVKDLSKYQDFVLQDGDILMSHINSETHLGKVALYQKGVGETIIHGMNLLSLRPNKDIITSEYAFYYLSSQAFLRQIPNITKKSVNQASFTVSALKELFFPVVSLTEQKMVIDNLDKVSQLIEERKQQLSKLDELVKAQFVEMFRETKQYPKEPLNDNVEQMFIGPFGSALKNECFVDASDAYCMVYEQKHAIQKTMDLPTRYVNEEKYKELKRFEIHGGDIIVSCRGTIGEIYSIPNDAPMGIMHPSIMKIRLNKEKYCNLFFVFMLEEFMRESIKKANGSGIKMAITATELGKELFVVPPIKKQNEFEIFAEQIDKAKFEVQQSLEKLETLKKSLMQQYFG